MFDERKPKMICRRNAEDCSLYTTANARNYKTTPQLATDPRSALKDLRQSTDHTDTVKISHEAKQMLHERRKEEQSMIISGTESTYAAREHVAAKNQTNEPSDSFAQYLADESAAHENVTAEDNESTPLEQKTLADAVTEFGSSPLLGKPSFLIFTPGSDATKYEYYGLLKQCHDETVNELDIDLDQYEMDSSLRGSPEGRTARKAIYEKFFQIPRAQELMQTLGFTELTTWGEPYNPNGKLQPLDHDFPKRFWERPGMSTYFSSRSYTNPWFSSKG